MGGMEQVKEDVRAVRMGPLLETVGQDVRYGVRTLARTPGFTTAAVLALALGIGATTAIFSVVDGVLLRPLPYREPARLAVLLHRGRNPVAPANFLDWKRDASSFEAMGAADFWQANLTGVDTPERVQGLHVTANLLPMLGVPPLIGRLFAPDEDAPGREHTVVLGYRLLQRRVGGDPSALRPTVTLDGEPHTVVGVMPRGFEFPPFWARGAEMWAAMPLADRAANRSAQSLRVFGRLSPCTSLPQARAEIATLTGRLEQAYPATNRDVRVLSLDDAVVAPVRAPLLVLLGAGAFALLLPAPHVPARLH